MLKEAGITNYTFEASVLVEHFLNISRGDLYTKDNVQVSDEDVERLCDGVKRRISGEPLQYIAGMWEFYSLPFNVRPGVLIPRPETELLVDTALEELSRISRPVVLDLCSGTGCIAVAIAKNRSGADVFAADLYPSPLELIKENAELNDVKINIFTADALQPPDVCVKFDMIVCNPPYIKTDDMADLQREVLREPATALDGGEDGLMFYRAVADNWRAVLKSGGRLAFEAGAGQFQDIVGIMTAVGFNNIRVLNDLSGIERVVVGSVDR